MSTEDLVTRLTNAHQTIRKLSTSSNDEDIQTALKMMKELETIAVTAEGLRTSGLNKILNELRKGSNAQLVAASKDLVNAFRTSLTANTASPSTSTATTREVAPIPSTVKRPRDETSSTKDSAPVSSKPRTSYVLKQTGEVFRDNMQGFIFDYLGVDEYSGDSGDFRTELAVRIERSIFETYGRDSKSSTYRGRCRTVMSNLKDPKNPFLNERLFNGACEPEALASMNETDMASDEMKKRREQDEEYMLALRKTDTDMGAKGTDMFTCPKCKKSNCNFYQKQTRSADEPMTTFITCLECKNKWRQY